MDLIAKLAFLHISLMWSLKNKVLSITIPKFLVFALIPVALFANIKVSNDDNCFLKWEVKCGITVLTGLLFNMFLVFHAKTSLTHA